MLKGKRIILSVTNDLTHDRRMDRICRSLAEAGADVILVGRELKDSKPFFPLGFTGHRLKIRNIKGPRFYAEYNRRLFYYLMKTEFDIACACDLDTALPVIWSCRLKRKKSVYDAHEFFTEVPELTGRPLIKSVWERIARMTIPRFDARYTVGEELANLMGKKYKVNFEVIRNIAPYQKEDVGSDPIQLRNKILLYQGALNVGRGLEASIRAMTNLPDWQFWLAGEGDITDQLKGLTHNLKLDQRVKFLGWVSPADLPGLMRQARLSINMRERGSLNDYYSLPNKFFDCIHSGLPSINMNYPEYLRVNDKYPCSILIDEVTPEKIVSTIKYLDDHPDQLMAMSKECAEAAKEYTWEKEAAKLLEMYEKLITD